MGMFLATMASLSTFHPDANPALQGVDMYMRPKNTTDPEAAAASAKVQVTRDRAILRMLGKSSTIAANTYRHRIGRPYNHPMPGCTNYAENILYMMDRLNEADFRPDARLVRILDKLLILLAGIT
jgi:citrate synthase